jgi:hypothetical protein
VSDNGVTRREFLKLGGIAALGALPLAKALAQSPKAAPSGPRLVYRLSLRGRRGSQAARKYNANHLFATPQAANALRAHPGDRSRVVSMLISDAEYQKLFANPFNLVVDLRQGRKSAYTAAKPAWSLYR